MAGAPQGGRGKVVAGINVTPLVDVVLVLLIIMMVTGQFIGRQMFEAELPKGASGEPVNEVPLVVEIRADRSIWVGVEQLDLAALAKRAKARDGADGEAASKAIIAADKKVDYGRVAEVIDVLRLAGIGGFGLEIKTGAPPVEGLQ